MINSVRSQSCHLILNIANLVTVSSPKASDPLALDMPDESLKRNKILKLTKLIFDLCYRILGQRVLITVIQIYDSTKSILTVYILH